MPVVPFDYVVAKCRQSSYHTNLTEVQPNSATAERMRWHRAPPLLRTTASLHREACSHNNRHAFYLSDLIRKVNNSDSKGPIAKSSYGNTSLTSQRYKKEVRTVVAMTTPIGLKLVNWAFFVPDQHCLAVNQFAAILTSRANNGYFVPFSRHFPLLLPPVSSWKRVLSIDTITNSERLSTFSKQSSTVTRSHFEPRVRLSIYPRVILLKRLPKYKESFIRWPLFSA